MGVITRFLQDWVGLSRPPVKSFIIMKIPARYNSNTLMLGVCKYTARCFASGGFLIQIQGCGIFYHLILIPVIPKLSVLAAQLVPLNVDPGNDLRSRVVISFKLRAHMLGELHKRCFRSLRSCLRSLSATDTVGFRMGYRRTGRLHGRVLVARDR